MKILSASQIRAADQYTIEHEPIASIDLMERASRTLYNWITSYMSKSQDFVIFCGTGNNGGDGLALARMLAEDNKKVRVYILSYFSKKSDDFSINEMRLKKLKNVEIFSINQADVLPVIRKTDVVVDAIFGSGLSKPVYGFTAQIIKHINKAGAKIIAVDIPSGLFCDTNKNNDGAIVEADITLTFECPKKAFMLPYYGSKAGIFHVLNIGLHKGYINTLPTKNYYTDISDISQIIKKRDKFSYKNKHGHALLISGSHGKTGASILASKACLMAGAGLLTAHIPAEAYQILLTKVPEAMVETDIDERIITQLTKINSYDAVGAGPGLGTHKKTAQVIEQLIDTAQCPMVLDADALNILASEPLFLDKMPDHTILTPHLKEFERLSGCSFQNGEDCLEVLVDFCKKYKCIVVFKGAHSCVCTTQGDLFFNSTGNSGMATAGSGDVLTGIVLAFLAQSYEPLQSALAAVYIHGLAADLAIETDASEESLLAGDISMNLGKAFKKLHSLS